MTFDPAFLSNSLLVLTAFGGAFLAALWVSLVVWTYRDIRSRARDPLVQILSALLVAVLNLPTGLPVGTSQVRARYDGNVGYVTSTSAATLTATTVAVPSLTHFGMLLLLGVMLGIGLVGVRRQAL